MLGPGEGREGAGFGEAAPRDDGERDGYGDEVKKHAKSFLYSDGSMVRL